MVLCCLGCLGVRLVLPGALLSALAPMSEPSVAGIIVFTLGLFLVPINSRMGTTRSLGMMALVLFTLEMLVGIVVWGVRAAL